MKKHILGLLFSLWASVACANVPCTLPFTLTNGTLADASQVMANYNAIVACLTNAAAAGANNDITSLNALSTPFTPAQGGSSVYVAAAASGGAANAQTVAATTPTGFSLGAPTKTIVFVAGFTNTGPTTLAVSPAVATNVFRSTPSGPQALTGGEIIAGNLVIATFDGTQFQIASNGPQFGGFGPLVGLAAAVTTDLGTVPTHNVNITGASGPITSFGSSASATYPLYYLTFANAPLLTYNATSLILPGAANIQVAAGDTADALYLGSGNWQVTRYNKANGSSTVAPTPLCGFSVLLINQNAGTPNTSIDMSYVSASLLTAANVSLFTGPQAFTINTTLGTVTSIVNGMDGETRGNNQMISIWAISNGSMFGGLASSVVYPTPPTLPAGYPYYCYAGSMKTNAAGNFYASRQSGAVAHWLAGSPNTPNLPIIVTGVAGANCLGATITWVGQTVQGSSGVGIWAPLTASAIDVVLATSYNGLASGSLAVAPNASYTGAIGTSPPPLVLSAVINNIKGRIYLEAASLQYCAITGNGATLFADGWVDRVNAN